MSNQIINLTMAPPKVSVPTEKAVDVTSYQNGGGGNFSGADGSFYMQKSGTGDYVLRTKIESISCTPIWNAPYYGTWDGTQWHSIVRYGQPSSMWLYPLGGFETGFRPTQMRAFFTKDDPNALIGCSLYANDQSIGYLGPWVGGPTPGETYVSGVSIPLDFMLGDPPTDTDFQAFTMHADGTGDIHLSGIEFYVGGEWKSYFCEGDL